MKTHTHGGDIYRYQNCIDFSANCNPLGTPDGVKQAIIECADHLADYPQVGCAPLKEAIAAYEEVQSNQVICGNGAADLIFSLIRARKPAHGLIPVPTFAEYEQALCSVDCQMHYFYLRPENGFSLTEDFLDALTNEIDIVFLCNPNNPTGCTIPQKLLIRILEKCKEMDIFLAVDECFLDFVKEPWTHTLKEVLDQYENLFLLKAFTKRYAMPGVRLGYGLCSNPEVLMKMQQMTQPWNVSTLAQMAGIAALKEEAYVEAGRQMVFEEAAFLKAHLRELGLTVIESEANYIFFKGPEDLFEKCLNQQILIRDCSNYPGLTKGYYRIAVKTRKANEQLIFALKRILEGSSKLWQKQS